MYCIVYIRIKRTSSPYLQCTNNYLSGEITCEHVVQSKKDDCIVLYCIERKGKSSVLNID